MISVLKMFKVFILFILRVLMFSCLEYSFIYLKPFTFTFFKFQAPNYTQFLSNKLCFEIIGEYSATDSTRSGAVFEKVATINIHSLSDNLKAREI